MVQNDMKLCVDISAKNCFQIFYNHRHTFITTHTVKITVHQVLSDSQYIFFLSSFAYQVLVN